MNPLETLRYHVTGAVERKEKQAIAGITSRKHFETVAWTGGSRPPSPSNVNNRFCGIQKALFGEQVEQWRKYWGDEPSWDTLRIYFNRARYDAHATTRK